MGSKTRQYLTLNMHFIAWGLLLAYLLLPHGPVGWVCAFLWFGTVGFRLGLITIAKECADYVNAANRRVEHVVQVNKRMAANARARAEEER